MRWVKVPYDFQFRYAVIGFEEEGVNPMSATLLPELAAESRETAERLVRLSTEEGLDAEEANYILTSGLAAIQRVPHLWRITRSRIAAGTATAHELLARLLEVVDKNLYLAGHLKEPARVVGEQPAGITSALARAEEQLRSIRDEAARLLKVVDVPPRWPSEEQLRQAKEQMQAGERLTAEEFRQALLGE
jgi:hypothetical protein